MWRSYIRLSASDFKSEIFGVNHKQFDCVSGRVERVLPEGNILPDPGWHGPPWAHLLWRAELSAIGKRISLWWANWRVSMSGFSHELSLDLRWFLHEFEQSLKVILVILSSSGNDNSLCFWLGFEGVSRSGNQLGLDDSRSGLVTHIYRLLDTTKSFPAFTVLCRSFDF